MTAVGNCEVGVRMAPATEALRFAWLKIFVKSDTFMNLRYLLTYSMEQSPS